MMIFGNPPDFKALCMADIWLSGERENLAGIPQNGRPRNPGQFMLQDIAQYQGIAYETNKFQLRVQLVSLSSSSQGRSDRRRPLICGPVHVFQSLEKEIPEPSGEKVLTLGIANEYPFLLIHL
jgi:hypothetical protein